MRPAGPPHGGDRRRARSSRCSALIVIIGSLKVGIGWGAEGPKAGFFPFYVGC